MALSKQRALLIVSGDILTRLDPTGPEYCKSLFHMAVSRWAAGTRARWYLFQGCSVTRFPIQGWWVQARPRGIKRLGLGSPGPTPVQPLIPSPSVPGAGSDSKRSEGMAQQLSGSLTSPLNASLSRAHLATSARGGARSALCPFKQPAGASPAPRPRRGAAAGAGRGRRKSAGAGARGRRSTSCRGRRRSCPGRTGPGARRYGQLGARRAVSASGQSSRPHFPQTPRRGRPTCAPAACRSARRAPGARPSGARAALGLRAGPGAERPTCRGVPAQSLAPTGAKLALQAR